MSRRALSMLASAAIAAGLALAPLASAVAQDAGADFTPMGAAEYARLTEQNTTLPLTADDIRAMCQDQLDRARTGLRAVMAEVGFEGSVEDFFVFLRSDDQFYYPDTDEGRAAYLAEARRVAAEMAGRLGELLEPPPTLTPLDAVEMPERYPPWTAAAYGSVGLRLSATEPPRETGALMFDLDDMRSAPRFFIRVLSYHEGIPGHHLEWTIARALPDAGARIPVYDEGWAAYAMMLPKELGLYQDPYDEAGRLGVLADSAARVLVDVGLNVDGWTGEDAVAFLLANTPTSERRAVLDVARAQARPAAMSVYIVGMLKFEELRARAEAALGDGFDLRAFHEAVLKPGPMTMPELEAVVDAWIADAAARKARP